MPTARGRTPFPHGNWPTHERHDATRRGDIVTTPIERAKLTDRNDLLRLLIFGCLTYGMLYFSYKWYALGGDFYYYYELYAAPLTGETLAPFHYRRLTPLLVWLVAELGIYYPLDVAFDDPDVQQRLWFAAFVVNYGGLVLSACVSAKIAEHLVPRERVTAPVFMASILAGALVFLSFLTLQKTLTVQNDGLTWFFVAVLAYAVLTQRWVTFTVACTVGMFQKEIVPLIGGGIVVIRAVVDGMWQRHLTRTVTELRERIHYLVVSGIGFALYFVYRAVDPQSGNPQQTDLNAIFQNLLDRLVVSPEFSMEMLLNGYLSQNILLILVAVVIWQWRRITDAMRVEILSYLVLIVGLVLLGYGVGMGSSIGRMGGFLTPVLTAYIAVLLGIPARAHARPSDDSD
jgi:hypothetical protein